MAEFCAQCGKKVSSDDRFCSACGHQLNDKASQASRKEIHWPDDFYRGNPVELSDDEINKYVTEVRDRLWASHDDSDFQFASTGDTFVWGYKLMDEIAIYVTRNYYSLHGFMDQDGNYTPYMEENE